MLGVLFVAVNEAASVDCAIAAVAAAAVAATVGVQPLPLLLLQELSALYAIADVLVITPIRDGMDVVPFEYVVSRECRRLPATVVLSEFAGCAR